MIVENQIKLKKIHTHKNSADMLTKIAPGCKVELNNMLVGLAPSDP